MKSPYKEELMEIYVEKPNFGNLKNPTNTSELENPICEDRLKVELNVVDGVIKDVTWSGTGCVIATVSASLLTEKIKGMKKEDVLKLQKKDLDKLLGIEVIPTKIKCELLILEAVKKALR